MAKVNIDKIAKKLGATRRGSVEARSGYFIKVSLRNLTLDTRLRALS
jgi:hypothetical protein